MSVQTLTNQQAQTVKVSKPLIAGKKFDIIFFIAVLWLTIGTFTDAWAHNNIVRLETFWTPWHGILYSGLAALIITLASVLFINHRRGASWSQAIPQGYIVTYLAMPLMMLVGLGDMTWHLVFGVEQRLDALFSPTHLTGILCIGLFATGPLCAMYMRKEKPSTFGEYFLLASAFALPYVFVMNAVQPFSVFGTVWPDVTPLTFGIGQLAAVGAMMLQALVFTFFTLYFTRRWTFKPGMFTYILGLLALCLSTMQQLWFTIPVFIIGGIIIDAAYWYLKPSTTRILQMRLFSAIVAGAPFAVYMAWLSATTHVVWTVHMLIGSVYMIMMVGWALSYLPYPSQLFAPPESKQ